MYRDVEHWGQTYPATIASARVITAGDGWEEVEVTHRNEGRVPNRLTFLSDTRIRLEESKQKFDASFLNEFKPLDGGGTHYVITAAIHLKGLFRVLQPFLNGYVRRQALRQMQSYVLQPLKTAAEKDRS